MKQIILRAAALLLCLTCLALPVLAEEEPLDAVAFFQEYSDLDLTPYQGRVILLNVFTEWCPYCMQEMPDLKAVSDMYDEDAFQLVLIHPWDGEDASNSENVQKKYGLEAVPCFEDKDGRVCQLLGLEGYPASLILDAQGQPVWGCGGMTNLASLTVQLDAMGVEKRK